MARITSRGIGGAGVPAKTPVRQVARRKSAPIAAGTVGAIDGRAPIKRLPPGVSTSIPRGTAK